MENVTLSSVLQSITFGHCFNQIIENVTLPNGLKNITYGGEIQPEYREYDAVEWPPLSIVQSWARWGTWSRAGSHCYGLLCSWTVCFSLKP